MSFVYPVDRSFDIIDSALRGCPVASVIVSLTKATPVQRISWVAKFLENFEYRMLCFILYANAQIIYRLSGPGAAMQQK